jgi:hypothetical protein
MREDDEKFKHQGEVKDDKEVGVEVKEESAKRSNSQKTSLDTVT